MIGEREADTGDAAPESRRRRSRLGSLGLVAAGLIAGLGVAYAFSLDSRQTPGPVSQELPSVAEVATESPAPLSSPVTPGAVDAQTAVERFLTAEARSDYAGSYDMLSAADREQVPNVEMWVASHADVLPPILGFEVEETTVEGAGGEVVTLVELEPGLNPVVGLIPGRAQITWVATAENGTWKVALAESRIEPLYPPEEEAVSAVSSWVTARQECQTGVSAGEHEGGLLGFPPAADELCGLAGEVRVDLSPPLSAADAAPFVAEFGPEFDLWSRVVEVESPRLRIVVAPVGLEWLVIGVLPEEGGP